MFFVSIFKDSKTLTLLYGTFLFLFSQTRRWAKTLSLCVVCVRHTQRIFNFECVLYYVRWKRLFINLFCRALWDTLGRKAKEEQL